MVVALAEGAEMVKWLLVIADTFDAGAEEASRLQCIASSVQHLQMCSQHPAGPRGPLPSSHGMSYSKPLHFCFRL